MNQSATNELGKMRNQNAEKTLYHEREQGEGPRSFRQGGGVVRMRNVPLALEDRQLS